MRTVSTKAGIPPNATALFDNLRHWTYPAVIVHRENRGSELSWRGLVLKKAQELNAAMLKPLSAPQVTTIANKWAEFSFHRFGITKANPAPAVEVQKTCPPTDEALTPMTKNDQKKMAFAMREQGKHIKWIAQQFGVSTPTIHNWIRPFIAAKEQELKNAKAALAAAKKSPAAVSDVPGEDNLREAKLIRFFDDLCGWAYCASNADKTTDLSFVGWCAALRLEANYLIKNGTYKLNLVELDFITSSAAFQSYYYPATPPILGPLPDTVVQARSLSTLKRENALKNKALALHKKGASPQAIANKLETSIQSVQTWLTTPTLH